VPAGLEERATSQVGKVLRHPLTGQASWQAAAQFTGIGLAVITTAVSARLMGPAAYGVAGMAIAYPSLLCSCLAVKSNAVTTRYLAALRSGSHAAQIGAICKLGFFVDFAASGAAFVLVGLSAGMVSTTLLHLPDMRGDTIIYAASLPVYSLIGTSGAILASWGRFRTLAFLQVLDRLMTLVSVVVALGLGSGVHGYVRGRAIAQVAIGLLMVAVASSFVRSVSGRWWWRSSLASIGAIRREILTFFGWNYVTVTLSGLVAQLPVLVLGSVRGPIEAGYYRIGANLVTIGSALESSLARVVYPLLSEQWGNNSREAVFGMVRRWTVRGGVPLACAALTSLPLLPVLVPWVLGAQYANMVLGTQVMMAAAAMNLAFFYATALYYAAGRVAMWAKAYAVYSLAVVALVWPVAGAWGFLGVAILTAGGEALFTVGMVLRVAAWTEQTTPHLPVSPKTVVSEA
jgi:O-antigen/teichoic acid export membrane protein